MLKHYVNEHHDNWDEYLPFVLFAYRTSVQSSVLETPFYLMHGRDPNLPHFLTFKEIRAANQTIIKQM